MSNRSRTTTFQDELLYAISTQLLPPEAQERALKLYERMKKPVRIALMGMPEAGKSTLMSLLVGAEVVPEDVVLPTLHLEYGEETETICTLPDGSKQTLPHANAREIAALSPVFVEMKMPLVALNKITVLEVVAPADADAMHRACQWASKRCDIAMWCTQGYGQTEQLIWSQMPEVIKSNAFLMITKADSLERRGILDAAEAAVRSVASGNFDQIFTIATKEALSSRHPDGTVNRELMRQSGGLRLISAVMKRVEVRKQPSVDAAEILLRDNAAALGRVDPKAADSAKNESVLDEVSAPQKPEEPTVAQRETRPEPKIGARLALIAKSAKAASEVRNEPPLQPATRDAYEHVLDYIVDQSRSLIDLAEKLGDAAPAQIMAKAVEHVQWLSDYLNENGDDADPGMSRTRDMAMDAADLVQLMQMEKRDSAAVEALSLMVQIKHELQAELAA